MVSVALVQCTFSATSMMVLLAALAGLRHAMSTMNTLHGGMMKALIHVRPATDTHFMT